MPEDAFTLAKESVSDAKEWYECPNGHTLAKGDTSRGLRADPGLDPLVSDASLMSAKSVVGHSLCPSFGT